MEDLKQIQEFFSKPLEENTWPEELTSRYSDEYRFELEKVTPTYQDKPGRAKYRVIDIESGELKGTPVFGSISSLQAFADDLIKPQGGTQSTNLGEMDINDPVLMKARAAKMKANQPKKSINPNYKAVKNASKIAFLKKEREQLMRDMEQEAEPEGGPIADEYGSKLNRIDKAIAKLSGRKEMTYDQAINEYDVYMPSQEEVDRFFALTNNETHYLNSKPVMGQEGTSNLMPIEPWDEYDYSNWKALVRKAKAKGKSLDEVKVDYDFSERELIRVLRQLKRGASTEIDMIKAFTKALGRDITKDELFSESINEELNLSNYGKVTPPKGGASLVGKYNSIQGKSKYDTVIFDYQEGSDKPYGIVQVEGHGIYGSDLLKRLGLRQTRSWTAGVDVYIHDGNNTPVYVSEGDFKALLDFWSGGLDREAKAQADFYRGRGNTSGTIDEALNPEVSNALNRFIKAMAKRYDYSEQDAVYAIMAALKQRDFDGVKEATEKDSSTYEQRMINQIKRFKKEGKEMFKLPTKTQEYYRKNKSKFEQDVNETSEEDKIDIVTMDVPLFIRVLEYAREDAQEDMDLHDLAEKAISSTKQQGILQMDDYDMLVGETEPIDESVNLKQSKLSSSEYQKAKKLKDFNKDDYEWDSVEGLYVKEKKSKFKKHGEMSGFDMRGLKESKNYMGEKQITPNEFANLKGKTIKYDGDEWDVIDSDQFTIEIKNEDGDTKIVNYTQFTKKGLVERILKKLKENKIK